jgi:hypothetical protein
VDSSTLFLPCLLGGDKSYGRAAEYNCTILTKGEHKNRDTWRVLYGRHSHFVWTVAEEPSCWSIHVPVVAFYREVISRPARIAGAIKVNIVLVFEIAGGVLLGLLLYRGLDGLSKRASMTLPATIFSVLHLLLMAAVVIGFVTLVVAGFYLMATRPEDASQYFRHHHAETMWALAIVLVLCVGYAAWSDLSDHKKSKTLEGE